MLACASLKRMFCLLNPTPCAVAGVTQTVLNPSAMPFRKAQQGTHGELHFTQFPPHLSKSPFTTEENTAWRPTRIQPAHTYVLKHSRMAPRPKGYRKEKEKTKTQHCHFHKINF